MAVIDTSAPTCLSGNLIRVIIHPREIVRGVPLPPLEARVGAYLPDNKLGNECYVWGRESPCCYTSSLMVAFEATGEQGK